MAQLSSGFSIFKDESIITKEQIPEIVQEKQGFSIFKDESVLAKENLSETNSKAKQGFAIFKDESLLEQTPSSKIKPKQGFSIFKDESLIANEQTPSDKNGQVRKAFEIFKDITEVSESTVQTDVVFEDKFSKKATGIPAFDIYKDKTAEIKEDTKLLDVVNRKNKDSLSKDTKNLDDETAKHCRPDFDISLFGTPGMPSYESTTVLPLRNRFKTDKLLTTFNDQTCTIDVRKLARGQPKSPLEEVIENKINKVENVMKEKVFQKDNMEQDIEPKKELLKENAHPKNIDKEFDESAFHKPVGFVSVPQSNKKNETIDRNKGHQLKVMKDLFDFSDLDTARKGNSKTSGDIDDMDFCFKKDSKTVDKDMDFMFSKSSAPITDQVVSSARSQHERVNSIDDILPSTNSKKRPSDTEFDDKNLYQKVKKQDTKNSLKDLINDPFDLSSKPIRSSTMKGSEERTPKEVSSVDKFKSILEDDCFKTDKDDNFEMMFQKETQDNSLFGKSRLNSESDFKKKSDSSFPGYSISDENEIDKRNPKQSIASASDDDIPDNAREPFKRCVSTPFLANHNKEHQVTFGQQISVNFEKTEKFDKTEYLSPIVERSNEDSKGDSNHRSRFESDDDNNDMSKSPRTPSQCLTFSLNQLKEFVKHILSDLCQSPNVTENSGSLPRINHDSMTLNIGTHNVRVVKAIKKHETYTIYKALIEERQLVLIKCLERNSNQFYHSIWDVYISNEIFRRISRFTERDFLPYQDKALAKNFLRHNFVSIFIDSVYIESFDHSEGTVLDTINLYKKHKEVMDESLALLYAYEVLNAVTTLHKIHILHGNIRPEVFLQIDSELTERGPLALHSILLTDFDRSIDLTLVPDCEKVMFLSSDILPHYPCTEIKEQKPWKYQVDYHASAATIHSIAFLSEMETYKDTEDNLNKIATKIPSHWNVTLWETLFLTLLNSSAKKSHLATLIERIACILSEPNMIESLKEARLKRSDLFMDDDDDDDDM